jgi:hypothetical protein
LDNGSGLFTTLSYQSDANGEVNPVVRLPTGAGGAGCIIRASGPTFTTSTDSSQIAVFPLATTHTWIGAASGNWQDGNNWRPALIPSSPSDNIFIPNYNPQGAPVVPVVSGPKPSMNKLAMDSLASLDLNNIGIDIGSGGVAGFGRTTSGSIHIQASASVHGLFDILDVGQSGSCGSAAPMQAQLVFVQANVLNVRCHAFVDTVVATTLNVLPNGGQGWLHLASGNRVLSAGTANFTGDSLWVLGGAINVTGTATFGGGGVNWSNASLIAQGNALFNSNHAFYSGAQIFVQGDATFGDPNTGQQQFAGGQLTILGNFKQVTGVVGGPGGLTFATSSDHVTQFLGSSTQTITFANPTTSRFSMIEIQNSSAGGVQLTTDAQIVNGTNQPRVEIFQGRLQVNTGATFTLNSGGFRFNAGTNLNLLGNITGVGFCSGLSNGATITGTGTYSGATCGP